MSSGPASDTEVIGAIDVGTNSFHLLVARVDGRGHFDVMAREKEVVRLGSGATDMKELAPETIDRGVATLCRFAQLAEIWQARVVAVATSAVREAQNRDEFISRAAAEAGIDVEVVSGVEEARLIHLGVQQAIPLNGVRHLLVDIGGGSTEIVVGDGSEIEVARSLKLGAIRLTNRFFGGEPVKKKDIAACRSFLRGYLRPLQRELGEFELAIGSSGTIATVAELAGGRSGDEPGPGPAPRRMRSFDRDDLAGVVDMILDRRTVAERRKLEGLDARRADIITAGVLLLESIWTELGVTEMTVSDFALREGVVLDALQRRNDHLGEPVARLHDLRRSNVMHLAQLHAEDLGHVERIASLVLQLFECTRPRHGLSDADRELLEAAALLHNVGVSVSHSAHHRHSYYLIRHSEHLTGFTEHEIELIAQTARYHRKSEPKTKHQEFAALSGVDQQKVRVMAGLLRVCIGLDRGREQVIERLRCRLDGDELVIDVDVMAGQDASLELYAAEQRRGLLERALGVEVVLRAG